MHDRAGATAPIATSHQKDTGRKCGYIVLFVVRCVTYPLAELGVAAAAGVDQIESPATV